jgi:hypothetical protein
MISVSTAAERPDLAERGLGGTEVWPEYNLHGDVVNQWWGSLGTELTDLQLLLHDETGAVVAEGHTGAFAWDGRNETLPGSFDEVIELVVRTRRSGAPVNTLCALAAETPRDGRRRGLAAEILAAMRGLAVARGLTHLVAPVRPSLKHRYPLAPIESYVTWRRADGELLDPWMRVHERLGSRIGTTMPQSLKITGTVADWTSWTGLAFPASGPYVFPEGLAPVDIDVEADRGAYWEPNVWMIHPDC